MDEYQQQALDFLASCDAHMTVNNAGLAKPKWDSKLHNTYDCEIKTPRGSMTVRFYDSLRNTELRKKPTEYDILSCLQAYEVGGVDEFMDEYGYEIKCGKDLLDFLDTYSGAKEEYCDICRVFTPEQIKKLREIQ